MERPRCPPSRAASNTRVLFAYCFSKWQIVVIKGFSKLSIHQGCLGKCTNDIFTCTDGCAQIIWTPAAVMGPGCGTDHPRQSTWLLGSPLLLIYLGHEIYLFKCFSRTSIQIPLHVQSVSRVMERGKSRIMLARDNTEKAPDGLRMSCWANSKMPSSAELRLSTLSLNP